MIVSILTRNTRLPTREAWQEALAGVLPKINGVFAEQPGFISVQYMWGLDGDGRIAQVTSWQSREDCLRYIREGGAAMVATIEEAAAPTAAHPRGNWVRETFEVAELPG